MPATLLLRATVHSGIGVREGLIVLLLVRANIALGTATALSLFVDVQLLPFALLGGPGLPRGAPPPPRKWGRTRMSTIAQVCERPKNNTDVQGFSPTAVEGQPLRGTVVTSKSAVRETNESESTTGRDSGTVKGNSDSLRY